MRRFCAVVLFAGVTLGASAAMADLPDPNVFLDYSGLGFSYTRTAPSGSVGEIGTFRITDVPGTTLDAILRDADAMEVDRATILNYSNFDVSVSGTVTRLANDIYALSGAFTATDDTGMTRVLADFASTLVDVTPVSSTRLFTIQGGLSGAGGTAGPILVGVDNGVWTFNGHAGDTEATLNYGGDDRISVTSPPVQSYTNGDLIDFMLGVRYTSLDGLFASSTNIGGGDMKVSIVPEPATLGLGLLGVGLVGLLRRRSN